MPPNKDDFPDILELMRQSAAATRVNQPSVAHNARGLWKTLEAFAESNPSAAVLAAWRHHTGAEFGTMGRYLQATSRLAQVYPCFSDTGCGDVHEVVSLDDGRWVARSPEDMAYCPGIMLTEPDLVVHEVDVERLGGELCRVLGFEPASVRCASEAAPKLWLVGTHPETRSPVYLALCPDEGQLMRNLHGLMTVCGEPFILLSPTARHRSELVGAMLHRERCAFVPLSSCLAPDGAGFRSTNVGRPILDRFAAGLAEGKALARTVEKIGRDIEAVARGNYELRQENEELKHLQADGYLKFALRVEGEDFRAFAVIMALGNRKAAAEFLKVPHRSLYDRVDKWPRRGKEYQKMARAVEWRKKVGRKITVPLGDAMQTGDAGDTPENPETMSDTLARLRDNAMDSLDYPALLGEILEALQNLNAKNWPAVQMELIGIIKDEFPQ